MTELHGATADHGLVADGAGAVRLTQLLASRELGLPLIAEAAAAMAAAVFAAHYVANTGVGANGLDLLMRVLRRFDNTVLFVMALLLTLRIVLREEEDRRDGWLEPVFASGAPRWRYGVALAASALVAAATTFAAGAIAFAAGIRVLTGSGELLLLLPRTLGAGFLLLGTFAVCTVALALVVRRVPAVLLIVASLTLLPLLLLMRYAVSEERPPRWILHLTDAAPLVMPPADAGSALRALLYIAVGVVLAGLVSARVAGRRP